MADRTGLKLVGYVFGSMTIAVMMIAGVMVKSYDDNGYQLDAAVNVSMPAR